MAASVDAETAEASLPESDPETRVESFDVDGKVPVTNELTVVDEGKNSSFCPVQPRIHSFFHN